MSLLRTGDSGWSAGWRSHSEIGRWKFAEFEVLNGGRLRGRQGKEHSNGAIAAGQIELASQPVLRDHRPSRRTGADIGLQPVDPGTALGNGSIKEQVHGRNFPGPVVVPLLP